MAFATCELSPSDYSDGIREQIPQLKYDTAKFIALNNAYTGIMEGGTTPNRQGDTIKTLYQGRVVTNQSYTVPVFNRSIEACGTTGPVAQFGSTEYNATMDILRGEGPVVCLRQARASVEMAYTRSEESLQAMISEIKAADIRATGTALSGFKVVAKAGATSLAQVTNGGEQQVAVAWPTGLPTSAITYKFLKYLLNYAVDNFSLEQWGEGAGRHAIFLGGTEIVEVLRNNADVRQDAIAAVQGSFKDIKDATFRYAYIDVPYRGIKMGIDQKPLRFNVLLGDGTPSYIEPYVSVATDSGVQLFTNPAWSNALYEIGHLIFKNTFRYLVPEAFRGEASFKFGAQNTSGELEWTNIRDNVCNKWGDFGNHIYSIERAIQPVRPHSWIPIAFKRCAPDFGLEACEAYDSDVSA